MNLKILYIILILAFLFVYECSPAQAEEANYKLSGFVDSYLAFDTQDNQIKTEEYLTQPHRDSEPNINLAYLRGDVEADSYRARLSLQAGSSVEANYTSEPNESFRFIQEAYAGYKLAEDLWLDAGIYLSHICIESFISKDNWAYTRLLASEFSPYYQSGARLSWDPSGRLSYQLHLLNGWQNISDVSGRTAIGAQIAYQITQRSTAIFNTFIGKELEGLRMFGDFILNLRLSEEVELGLLTDIGNQQRQDKTNDHWYDAAALIRYHLNPKLRLITRVEYYSDPNQVIVSTLNGNSFETFGVSIGVDYEPIDKLLLRAEYRRFLARDEIYRTNNATNFSDTDSFVVFSLSYSFSRVAV